MIGKEDAKSVITSLDVHYEEKNILKGQLKDDGYDVCMFDMHDGKMLYILSGHGLWNRKNYPFLLCKCKRKEGVVNADHVCKIMTHTEQTILNYKSLCRWNEVLNSTTTISYSKTDHMNWVDETIMGYLTLVLVHKFSHHHAYDLTYST